MGSRKKNLFVPKGLILYQSIRVNIEGRKRILSIYFNFYKLKKNSIGYS